MTLGKALTIEAKRLEHANARFPLCRSWGRGILKGFYCNHNPTPQTLSTGKGHIGISGMLSAVGLSHMGWVCSHRAASILGDPGQRHLLEQMSWKSNSCSCAVSTASAASTGFKLMMRHVSMASLYVASRVSLPDTRYETLPHPCTCSQFKEGHLFLR